MSEKIIDDFEKMINEVCGEVVKLEKKKYHGRPTPDFYDLPFQHEDFMRWYKDKEEEKNALKHLVKCTCGEDYIIYIRPDYTCYYSSRPDENYTTQFVTMESFFCYKCGRRFDVCNAIIKIKSTKLEVVL